MVLHFLSILTLNSLEEMAANACPVQCGLDCTEAHTCYFTSHHWNKQTEQWLSRVAVMCCVVSGDSALALKKEAGSGDVARGRLVVVGTDWLSEEKKWRCSEGLALHSSRKTPLTGAATCQNSSVRCVSRFLRVPSKHNADIREYFASFVGLASAMRLYEVKTMGVMVVFKHVCTLDLQHIDHACTCVCCDPVNLFSSFHIW